MSKLKQLDGLNLRPQSSPPENPMPGDIYMDNTGTVMFYTNMGWTSLGVSVGTIEMWGAVTPPTNYLICDGSSISRTTYAALFAIIGTTYGLGDNEGEFRLPDFRAVSPRGAGTRTVGANSKTGPALGESREDAMQSHTHIGEHLTNHTGSTVGYSGETGTRASTQTSGVSGGGRTSTETRANELGVNFIIKY